MGAVVNLWFIEFSFLSQRLKDYKNQITLVIQLGRLQVCFNTS